MYVTKADGIREEFKVNKLRQSLERAGAENKIKEEVINTVLEYITDGMTTQEIYRHAFELLKEKTSGAVAARYSIKRAILDLGPSGFPFEQFVAALFRAHGATNVHTGIMMQGRCAPHEVDVLGIQDGKRFGIEVKYHHSLGIKTDLKTALYVKARFDDLREATTGDHIDQGWLITNTKFTSNVRKYAKCAGLKLIGWDYPRGNGIEMMTDRSGVHPLTCLTKLSDDNKRKMLDDNIVLCRDIHEQMLRDYGVRKKEREGVLAELRSLCKNGTIESQTELKDNTIQI